MRPTTEQDQARARRIELILEQIDSLPTLPSVASRLLKVSSAADADFRQIVSMIESDPALTAKILGLCRKADKRRAEEITTVDRAVVYLGFEAVRAAALSVNVYDLLAEKQAKADAEADAAVQRVKPLDRKQFWRRSIAVACAAEGLAQRHASDKSLPPATGAFVCGLLHGVGVLALEHALPKAYARVLHLAARSGDDLASVERSLIGIDHHTAGRRLAERWDLPVMLRDVIWLAGLPYEALPEGPNRRVVGLINVAVAIARRLHLGWSGDPSFLGSPERLCEVCGLDAKSAREVEDGLHDEVAARAAMLGLEESDSGHLLLECIQQANHELERLRDAGARSAAQTERNEKALSQIARFRGPASQEPAGACEAAAHSVASLLAANFTAIARRFPDGAGWEVRRFATSSAGVRILPSVVVDSPAPWESAEQAPAERQDEPGASAVRRGSATEIAAAVGAATTSLRALDLPDARAVVLHDGQDWPGGLENPALAALGAVWAAALVSISRVERLRTLEEELARVGASVATLREREQELTLHRRRADFILAALNETAKPLQIIRARAETLQQTLSQQRDQRNVEAVVAGASRFEALCQSLRLAIDPPRFAPAPTDLAPLLGRSIRNAMQRIGSNPKRASQPRVRLLVDESAKRVTIDAEKIEGAAVELVANALEIQEVTLIEVAAQKDPATGRLLLSVKDDGPGMPGEALEKAFEPFAFVKKGSQRKGLGLYTARRLTEIAGGTISAAPAGERGLLVTISLDLQKALDYSSKSAAESPDQQPRIAA